MSVLLSLDNKKILKHLKKIKYRNTNKDNFFSQISIDNKILNKNYFKELKKTFEKSVVLYLQKLEYGQSFKILNSWSTKTPNKSSSESHVHSNSWISGVYYPHEDKSFSIMFEKNNYNFMYNVEYTNYNNIYTSSTYTVNPKTGTLLIFPSTLMHKITKNNSDEDRYSIAFSIVPVGTFNKGRDSEITYG